MTIRADFGYFKGERLAVRLPLKASQTIAAGEFITLSSGYAARAAATNKVYGVALETVTSPATDGVETCLVDVSEEVVYKLKTDATVSLSGHQFKTCDFGGYASDGTPQIDADGTTNDDLYIVDVDVTNQIVFVKLKPAPASVA